jgi:hypothetical protein
MDGKDKDQAQETSSRFQDKGEDGSSNPISHEDCHPFLLEDGISLVFHWAQGFSS